MIIGVSAGVGKSTFAMRLGKALKLDVFHLDSFYWKQGWVESSLEEFTEKQEKMLSHYSSWIVEGNYSSTIKLRADHADTIIYLELPLRICLYRVIMRWLTNLGYKRHDLGGECTEKMDFAFIKFIVTTYRKRKKWMREFMNSYHDTRRVICLKNKKEIEYFLKGMEGQKR